MAFSSSSLTRKIKTTTQTLQTYQRTGRVRIGKEILKFVITLCLGVSISPIRYTFLEGTSSSVNINIDDFTGTNRKIWTVANTTNNSLPSLRQRQIIGQLKDIKESEALPGSTSRLEDCKEIFEVIKNNDKEQHNIDEDIRKIPIFMEGNMSEVNVTRSALEHNGEGLRIDGKNETFSGVVPRAFKAWPHHERPFPCFRRNYDKTNGPKSNGIFWRNTDTGTSTKGFFFLKPEKVGGSTVTGIQLRIARNVAERIAAGNGNRIDRTSNINNKNQKKNNKNNNKSSNSPSLTNSDSSLPMCHVNVGHFHGYQFSNITKESSFLWSWIREPSKRVVSEFFHFMVSRRKVEPTNDNFRRALEKGDVKYDDYYIELHEIPDRPNRTFSIPRQKFAKRANSILDDYNFIGITERFEESTVALQLLLGLPTSDVLYFSAKSQGGFDDGAFNATCHYIVPSFVSPGMKQFFETDKKWKQAIKWDVALYRAANASLDLTIDYTIGRSQFEQALRKFRHAQSVVQQRCGHQVKTPCTSGGKRRKPEETDCFWADSGCGSKCIDEVVEQFGL